VNGLDIGIVGAGVGGLTAAIALQRQGHRISVYEQAGRFAAKHRETTQKRMEELQAASATSWADVAFLESATDYDFIDDAQAFE
jgi:2-polyprenyl-6-methoxyphenol hydroxylase-like FAD-dependent oxidoreductase